jgi:hypothetical protein
MALRTSYNSLFSPLVKMDLSLLYLCTPHIHLKDMFHISVECTGTLITMVLSFWKPRHVEQPHIPIMQWIGHWMLAFQAKFAMRANILAFTSVRSQTVRIISISGEGRWWERKIEPLKKVESLQQFIRRLLEAVGTYTYPSYVLPTCQ